MMSISRLSFRQRHDVRRRVFQRSERLAIRRRNRIVEGAGTKINATPQQGLGFKQGKRLGSGG